MIALMNFREDGITPYMLFFKDGLVEEKCVSKAKQSKKLFVFVFLLLFLYSNWINLWSLCLYSLYRSYLKLLTLLLMLCYHHFC